MYRLQWSLDLKMCERGVLVSEGVVCSTYRLQWSLWLQWSWYHTLTESCGDVGLYCLLYVGSQARISDQVSQ